MKPTIKTSWRRKRRLTRPPATPNITAIANITTVPNSTTIPALTKFRTLYVLAFTALLFQGCGPKIYAPPHFGNMQLTLTGILPHCYTTVTGTTRIPWHGAVQVWYFDSQGRNRMPGSSFNFTSPANSASAVQLTVSVPDNNSNYQLEVIVYGDNCSLCAPDVISISNSCLHNPDPSGGYQAAKPKLDYSYRFTSYRTSETLDLTNDPPNEFYDCGCIVPN